MLVLSSGFSLTLNAALKADIRSPCMLQTAPTLDDMYGGTHYDKVQASRLWL